MTRSRGKKRHAYANIKPYIRIGIAFLLLTTPILSLLLIAAEENISIIELVRPSELELRHSTETRFYLSIYFPLPIPDQ